LRLTGKLASWITGKDKHRNLDFLAAILFGIYIAAVLWITLLSRLGTGYRGFLFPFQSYIKVFCGNWRALVENIENVILFVPLGLALRLVKKWRIREVVIIGLCTSLSIELLQAIFALGTFECDDLFHNTIGTVFGYCFGYCLIEKQNIQIAVNKSLVSVALVAVLISVSLPFGYQRVQYQHMVKLAALHDSVDGGKNLLVLNGKDGYAWNTDVRVSYLDDGSIRIKGTSDRTSWWPIGDITLESGKYTFSGLSGVEANTVGLELESNNRRFAPDVGEEEMVSFSIEETTKLKVYVIVYDGCDCDVIATPVIYIEE